MHLQSLLESENFYQEIIHIIQNRFNYYSIQIWSVASDFSYILRAQAGESRNHLKIGYLIKDITRGIMGTVIKNKKSYLSNDVSGDPHYTDLSLPFRTQSELSVPVIKNGAIVAVLNVESDQKEAFDEDDVITLEAVASQIAVSITNRKLYHTVTQFNKKLQRAVEEKTLELRRAHERILEQQEMLQKGK